MPIQKWHHSLEFNAVNRALLLPEKRNQLRLPTPPFHIFKRPSCFLIHLKTRAALEDHMLCIMEFPDLNVSEPIPRWIEKHPEEVQQLNGLLSVHNMLSVMNNYMSSSN